MTKPNQQNGGGGQEPVAHHVWLSPRYTPRAVAYSSAWLTMGGGRPGDPRFMAVISWKLPKPPPTSPAACGNQARRKPDA